MNTITTTEGAKSGLNNPGNVIYVGQAGATPSSNCFTDTNTGNQDCIAQFATLQDGTDYLTSLIQSNAASGMTIAQFAAKYAPASGYGNNPTAYAQYIASATGLSVNDPLSAAIASDGSTGSTLTDQGGTVVSSCDPTVDPTCDPGMTPDTSVDWGVVGMAFAAVALIMVVSGR